VREAGWKVLVVLQAAVALALLSGCSLEQEKPKEIRPPPTPTDVREADRVGRALEVYLEDRHLIRETRRSCSSGLPVGLFERVCGPELRPLLAQQRTHLREGLDDLRARVGRRCAAALRQVGSVAVGRAGNPLRVAKRSCLREYRRAASSAGAG
jgi:hypothetical protein